MTINLTKYYVEVAGQNTDGEVRVYRQYVSVLYRESTGNSLEESRSDTLNLSQAVTGFSVKPAPASDTLNLTQVVAGVCAKTLSVSDTLTFQQSALKSSSNYVVLIGLAINSTDLIVYSDTPKKR